MIKIERERHYTNKVACAVCGEVLESRYCHDFVACHCGSIYIDGGNAYWRRGGEFENIIPMWDLLGDEVPVITVIPDMPFKNTEHGWIG